MNDTTNVTLKAEDLKEISIDDLLEVGIDEIEDAAGFVLPPMGAYTLNIVSCAKVLIGAEGEEKAAIQVELSVAETVELSDPTQDPVAEGAEFSIAYFGGQGAQYFKTEFGQAAKDAGAVTLGDMFEKLPTCNVFAQIGHRKAKNTDRVYPTLSDIKLT